jgi:hypothetical protein
VPEHIDFIIENIKSTIKQNGRILPDDLYRWRNGALKRAVDIWQADEGRDIEQLKAAVDLFSLLLEAKVTPEVR